MDKKQLITVSVLGALIVALVCFVVFSSENTERLTKNQLLRIEDTIYELSQVEKFVYITNEKTGDIDKVLSEEERENIFNEFVASKLYSTVATKKSILFPEEELTRAKEDYARKSETFQKYGVTEEDYLEYAEDDYKKMQLSSNFGTYYKLPDEYYQEFVNFYSGDELTTYSYRLMNFRYEVPESGEEASAAADVSGDAVEHEGHDHEEEKEPEEDRTQATVLAKAQTALAAVKSGDDFETVAKEYSDGSYTIHQNGIKFFNGEIQYAIQPVLESKLGDSELYEAIKKLQPGEYTDIIEIADSTTYYFLKLENIEEGFVGEAAEEVKDQLLYEYQQTLMMEDISYEANQGALLRFVYKQK